MSQHGHKRWEIGPFASGAYSPTGGHWKVLGLMRSWIPHPSWHDVKTWCVVNELSLFGAFACRWGDGRFQWAFFSMSVTFRRARWRYGEREKRRQERASRKRWEKTIEKARADRLSSMNAEDR